MFWISLSQAEMDTIIDFFRDFQHWISVLTRVERWIRLELLLKDAINFRVFISDFMGH